jgi:hypothetical protein
MFPPINTMLCAVMLLTPGAATAEICRIACEPDGARDRRCIRQGHG